MAVHQGAHNRPIWVLVGQREMRVRTRSKVFGVSTAAMVVLIVAGVLAVHFLTGRTTTYHVGVTSDAASAVVIAAGGTPRGLRIESRRFPDRPAAEAAVRSGKVDAVLLSPSDQAGRWTLEAKGAPNSTLQSYLAQTVQLNALQHNADTAGLPLSAVTEGGQLDPIALNPSTNVDSGLEHGVTFAFGLLFFLSCQLFGTSIANSVVEEKESRVVEVLIAAIPMRALLVGKVVGNALLGIAQMALFAAAALVTAAAVGNVPHLGSIFRSSGWFLMFYIVGFGTVCCLFAGLGALASRSQDVQAATAPLQMVITGTYLVSIIGQGMVVKVASFVPITSTVTMPARLFAGVVPWWQVALSLALAIAFAALSIRVSARVYRFSVLHSGSRLSLLASLRDAGATRTESTATALGRVA